MRPRLRILLLNPNTMPEMTALVARVVQPYLPAQTAHRVEVDEQVVPRRERFQGQIRDPVKGAQHLPHVWLAIERRS